MAWGQSRVNCDLFWGLAGQHMPEACCKLSCRQAGGLMVVVWRAAARYETIIGHLMHHHVCPRLSAHQAGGHCLIWSHTSCFLVLITRLLSSKLAQ